MKQKNRFIFDMLDQDSPDSKGEIIYKAGKPTSVRDAQGSAIVEIPFVAQEIKNMFLFPAKDVEAKISDFVVRAYGDSIVRLTSGFGGTLPKDDKNPMLQWDASLSAKELHAKKTDNGWDVADAEGQVKARITTKEVKRDIWSTLQPEPAETFDAVVFPDGKTSVPFMAYDEFFPGQSESMSLGYVEKDGKPNRCLFSLFAEYNEKFAGTGERFFWHESRGPDDGFGKY